MTGDELERKVVEDVVAHGDLMTLLRLRLLQGKPISDVLAAKADEIGKRLLDRAAGPSGSSQGQLTQQVNSP